MISFENHQIQFSKLNNDTVQMTFDSSSKTVQTNFRNFKKSGDTTACFTQFQTSFQAKPPYQKKLGRFFKAPLMYRFSKDHEDQCHKKKHQKLGA